MSSALIKSVFVDNDQQIYLLQVYFGREEKKNRILSHNYLDASLI